MLTELEKELQKILGCDLTGDDLLGAAKAFYANANEAAKAASDEKRDADLAAIRAMGEKLDKHVNEVPPEGRKLPPSDGQPKSMGDVAGAVADPLRHMSGSSVARVVRTIMENRTDEMKALEKGAIASMMEAAWKGIPVQATHAFEDQFAKYAPTSVLAKVLSQVGTAAGAEWLPTLMMSRVIDLYRISESILSEHEIIPGLGYTNEIPMWLSGITLYYNPPSSDDAKTTGRKSTPGTGKLSYTPKEFFVLVAIEEHFEEDALAAALTFFDQQLIRDAVDNLDNFIVNGSSAATHLDSDITDPNDGRKAWDGYRKFASDASTTLDLSTFSDANFEALLVKLGRYGIRTSQLRAIIEPTVVYPKIRALCMTSAITNQLAGFQNGEITSWHNVKLIKSDHVRTGLNASGVVDGITPTYTCLPVVNVTQAVYVQKNDFEIKRVEEFETGRPFVRIRVRGAFVPIDHPTTRKTIAANGIKIS
jgi:hypothetical protein